MMLFCSAAVPSASIRNSAETSASSASAFSTPRRAIVQKSDELLVTNATVIGVAPPEPAVFDRHEATSATAVTRARRRAVRIIKCSSDGQVEYAGRCYAG